MGGQQTFSYGRVPAHSFDKHAVELREGIVDPLLGASELVSLHVLAIFGLAGRVCRVHLFLAVANFVEVDLVSLDAIR